MSHKEKHAVFDTLRQNTSPKLNSKWIKASMLGTIWASSEIVLGSFLHNLKIPFSGNILTAIGLVILISASYKWREKGIYWRAGIICAMLKTLSPSAVIFGPMVAILSEAALLEISVQIFGHTIPAFMLGSMLAMSWNLFQKLFNYIIFYGSNIVEVYTRIMQYAEQQLQLEFDAVWTPIIILLCIYSLLGAAAALIGIYVGRSITKSVDNSQLVKFHAGNEQKVKESSGFHYSILWLAIDAMLMLATLLLAGRANFLLWTLLISTTAAIWAFRYKRALKQLMKPRLWVFFVIITMLTTFVFTRLQPNPTSLTHAVLIGVEMNLRAVIVIMGFAVIGTELYHPKIRSYLAQSYFKQLPPAMELSLEILPALISNMPDVKTILRNPGAVVRQLFAYADQRLDELAINSKQKGMVYILSGKVGSGKTRAVKNLAISLQENNIPVTGIYSSRIMENGETKGYSVVNISTGNRTKFLHQDGSPEQEKIGRFYIFNEGLCAGVKALKPNGFSVTIVDEVGRLELDGKGWYHSLLALLNKPNSILLLTVRDDFVPEVVENFNLSPKIISIKQAKNYEQLTQRLIKDIQEHEKLEV